MILEKELKEQYVNNIISVCRKEILEKSNKELLSLIIDYFYDGKAIDIGCEIQIFDNDEDESYTRHISFTLTEDEKDSDLAKLLKGYDQETRFNKIEQAASEIKDYLETIDWGSIVKIADEMFIDLELYD